MRVFAVQIARALGARVSATASAGDIEYVRSLGADVVIDYKAAAFEDRVSDVDVVLDPIGGRTAEASVGVLNDGGSLISLAGPPTGPFCSLVALRKHTTQRLEKHLLQIKVQKHDDKKRRQRLNQELT